ERAQWLRFHTQTAGVSLTAQQPDNNVVRTAVEALAAVLGGTNSLPTNALDEGPALPRGEAAGIPLRTQQGVMEGAGGAQLGPPAAPGTWRRSRTGWRPRPRRPLPRSARSARITR